MRGYGCSFGGFGSGCARAIISGASSARLAIAATILALSAAAGCSRTPSATTPPAVVDFAPVAQASLQDLPDSELDKYLSTAEQNVRTATAEKERRREGKLVAWAAGLAGLCALVAILAVVGMFCGYTWLTPFKPLLGEIATVAGAAACLLGWAAWKMHAILSWLPIVALGAAAVLGLRLGSKYVRVWMQNRRWPCQSRPSRT